MKWIAANAPLAKVRPDQKVVWFNDWNDIVTRLKGTRELLQNLVKIAEGGRLAA